MNQRPLRSMLIAAAMLSLVFAMSAAADIAPNPGQPRPPRPTPAPPPPPVNDKATDLPLTIKLHENGKPMKLELPEKQAGAKAAVGAEAGGDTGASTTRSIIAALMLSLGAMAGGLWLARKRSRGPAMAVATVLAIAGAGLWASEALGNKAAGPPPPVKPVKPAGLSIRIESSKGEAAVLHISEEQLKAIAEQVAAQKKAAAEVPVVPNIRNAPPPPG